MKSKFITMFLTAIVLYGCSSGPDSKFIEEYLNKNYKIYCPRECKITNVKKISESQKDKITYVKVEFDGILDGKVTHVNEELAFIKTDNGWKLDGLK